MSFDSSFPLVTLKEVVKFINGDRSTNYPKGDDYCPNGIPFISAADLGEDGIDQQKVKRISVAAYDRLRSGKIQFQDILFCLRGSIGKMAYVKSDEIGAIASSLVIVRATERIDSRYLSYVLRSRAGQHAAHSLDNGSAQPNLSVSQLQEVLIPLPSLSVQKEIAGALGTFDDRITLLHETNSTLDAIAQTLFKSWFLDFDPIHAKRAGRIPHGMDEATAALFPDELIFTQHGEIPKGWEILEIKDLLERITVTKRYTKTDVSKIGEWPVYEQGASILLGYHSGVPNCMASPEAPMFIFGDHTCITKLSCQPFDVSQNVILIKGSIRNTIWTYYAVNGRQRFEEYRRHWMELVVKKSIVPTIEICNKYAEIVLPLQLAIEANENKINTLANLKEALLPRLMSAQLTVPSQKEIEGATV